MFYVMHVKNKGKPKKKDDFQIFRNIFLKYYIKKIKTKM